MSRSVFSNRKSLILAAASSVAIAVTIAIASPTLAAGEAETFDIAEQPLSKALLEFSEQTDIVVVAPRELVNGKSATAVQGDMAPSEALAKILDSTGLNYTQGTGGGFTIVQTAALNEEGRRERGFLRLAQAGAQSGRSVSDRGAPAQMQTDTIEVIIVTAQKREQNILDVPFSVVTLSGEDIASRNIDDLESMGFAVPGVVVQQAGAYTRRIFMRGIGTATPGSATVGLYLDELTLSGGESALSLDLRAHDLERLEVLRGPQGTLFGQGSMGGTIRMISNPARLDAFETQLNSTISFTEDGGTNYGFQGVVNIPLVEDKLALRVSGLFEDDGGWIDQPAVEREDINGSELANVRAKLRWAPTEAFGAVGSVIIHRNDASSNHGEDEFGNYTQAFGQLFSPRVQDEYTLYNLTMTYDLGIIEFLSTSTYYDTDKQLDRYGTVFELRPPPSPLFNNQSSEDRTSEIFNQELRATYAGENGLAWTIGGFYQDTDGFIANELFGAFGDELPPARIFSGDQLSEIWAVFGDLSYDLTSRLQIGGGLRYFEDSQKDAPFGDGVQEATFDSLSPRAYIHYDIADNIALYANVAKGFRSGGFNNLGQPAYGPEEVWAYEGGLKGSLFDGRFNGEVSLFFSEYTDYQIAGLVLVGETLQDLIANAGDIEIKGLDAAFDMALTNNFSITASVSLIDAEFVSVTAENTNQIVGDRPDNVPEYHYSISAIYDFELLGRSGAARIDYNEVGESMVTFRTFPTFTSQSGVVNTLNVNLDWDWSDSLTFSVFAENLTNDRAFLDGFVPSRDAARLRPRTIGFKADVQF